jgi:hypothetical protein
LQAGGTRILPTERQPTVLKLAQVVQGRGPPEALTEGSSAPWLRLSDESCGLCRRIREAVSTRQADSTLP